MSEAAPPPIVPQITHTPSQEEPPPPSPTSSTCSSSSIATEDISDSGEDLPAATMEPSEYDYLTHGDLRSPGREFARERSLRKKAPHRHTSSTSVQSPPVNPGVQPTYPSDDDEDKRKHLTPEERSKARKKAKKTAKAEKKKALKSQEAVKNPRKREDRRREDDIAAVEASMAALKTEEQPEGVQTEETGDVTTTQDRQRRRSSNALARPAKPRKTSSSTQGGGSGGGAAVKSPKIGVEADEAASPTPGKRGNAKHVAAFTQYHVEEGMHVHEKSNDIDFQMAALAKMEALNERSRGGKIARGLEELEKRKMERKRDEALKGVVDTAQERYEDEKLARLYGLK
ncbi:hypothetical protein TWF281_000170 [Arthrobotrys megalospora]